MSPFIRLISPLVFALIAPALYANQKLRRGWAQRLGRHADGFGGRAAADLASRSLSRRSHGAAAGDSCAARTAPELGIVVSSMTESGQRWRKPD